MKGKKKKKEKEFPSQLFAPPPPVPVDFLPLYPQGKTTPEIPAPERHKKPQNKTEKSAAFSSLKITFNSSDVAEAL